MAASYKNQLLHKKNIRKTKKELMPSTSPFLLLYSTIFFIKESPLNLK